MRSPTRIALALCLLAAATASRSQTDALDLQSAPTPQEAKIESPLRLFLEAGIGRIEQRFPDDERTGKRLSLDLRYNHRLSDELRFAISNRLDHVSPAPFGQEDTINSLREIYFSWQPEGSSGTLEFGRINLRQGAAFGYNPTDYFRTGGLRAVTTADPVALRQIRQGAAMVKGSLLWSNGGATIALAPKLQSAPDDGSFALDLGSTNSKDRALLSVQTRASEKFSAQGSLFLEQGSGPNFGISSTALLGEALVAHADLAVGKKRRLLDQILNSQAGSKRTVQAAVGLTYTLPSALALTLEFEHNGAGLERDDWAAVLNQGPLGYRRFVSLTQPHQELGARNAWLVYVSQKSLGLKQLDLTAFVRTNTDDRSRLGWFELRYHWPQFDAVLQWQRASGRPQSEFGALPYRQLVQVLGVLYF